MTKPEQEYQEKTVKRAGPCWLQRLFFLLLVRPFLALFIGVNWYHRDRLAQFVSPEKLAGSTGAPQQGRPNQVIIVANHNSHLDTLLLMCLFPNNRLHQLHPVAAADYFMVNPVLAWFATHIMNIVPIPRKEISRENNPITRMEAVLAQGDSLILFPEGSRGEPEVMKPFQNGIGHLIMRNPKIPVVPVFIRGAGRSLPKGEAILLPMFCDVVIGEPLRFDIDADNSGSSEASRSKASIVEAIQAGVTQTKAWLEAETFALEEGI